MALPSRKRIPGAAYHDTQDARCDWPDGKNVTEKNTLGGESKENANLHKITTTDANTPTKRELNAKIFCYDCVGAWKESTV
jgi:hypothetical protein